MCYGVFMALIPTPLFSFGSGRSVVGGVYTVGLGQGFSVTKGVSGGKTSKKKRMEKRRFFFDVLPPDTPFVTENP
jgi:hypothetical protein